MVVLQVQRISPITEALPHLASLLSGTNATNSVLTPVSRLLAYILDATTSQLAPPCSNSPANDSVCQALESTSLDRVHRHSSSLDRDQVKSREATESGTDQAGADISDPSICIDGQTCVYMVKKLLLPLAARGPAEKVHCQHALKALMPQLRQEVEHHDSTQQLLHQCDELLAGESSSVQYAHSL